MDFESSSSTAAQVIQCAGIVLVTVLSFFVSRSIGRRFLNYWTTAWAFLSLALASLLMRSRFPPLANVLTALYFLGEYGFGLLFVAGCLSLSSGARIKAKHLRLSLIAIIFAIALSQVRGQFAIRFIPHAAVLASLVWWAFRVLQRARPAGNSAPGLRVMSIALILLTLDFLHYIPVLAYALTQHAEFLNGYLRYTSIYDLILEILLGFGTVMVAMENVRQDLETTNRELLTARDRLQVLAQMDPLTETLNRHAFYSLLERNGKPPVESIPGCVVIVDIDNLKPINDTIGHSAGDNVIRAVARVIRSVIRTDDLLFRWGGDEFLIIQFGASDADVRRRIDSLNSALVGIAIGAAGEPDIPITVSYGIANFSSLGHIEQAIDRADEEMYSSKLGRRTLRA